KWYFWLFLIGYHLIFMPLHISGLNGTPRSANTSDGGEGLALTNILSIIVNFFMSISILFLFYNLYITHSKSETVGEDSWDGRTLEWTVDSSVPEETFTPMTIVEDYDPLWQAKLQGKPMKTTDSHRASPNARDTIIPFVMTMILGLFSIFMMYHWYIL